MPNRHGRWLLLLSADDAVQWYEAGDLATGLIAYWPLSDNTTQTLYADQGANGVQGTVGGVGNLHDSGTLYISEDGAAHVNLYSAAFESLFDLAEHGVWIRAKVASAAVYADGLSHRTFKLQGHDGDNSTTIRIIASGDMVWRRWGDGGAVGTGNGSQSVVQTTLSDTDWMTLALTCSEAADEFKAFHNGAQVGTTQTGLGAATGPMLSTEQTIGATSTSNNDPWHGWLSDFIATLNGVVPTDADHSAIHSALSSGTLSSAELDSRFGAGNWMWLKLDDSDVDEASGNASPGRSVGATPGGSGMGDGRTAFSFDGSGDYINIWSPTLRDAFDPTNFSASAWFYVDASAWTDGDQRVIFNLGVDASNRAAIYKRGGLNDDQIQFLSVRGGTSKPVNVQMSGSGWHHVAIQVTGGQMKAFLDGVQTGATQTAIGTWAGSLDAASTIIGAAGLPLSGAFEGRIAHVAIHSPALSDAQIADLMGVFQ